MSELSARKLPQNSDELASFVDALKEDLRANAGRWENVTLSSYLEALSAVIRDGKGSVIADPSSDQLPIREIAHLLEAASIYE